MIDLSENYNNPIQSNDLRVQLEKMTALEDKFVVLTYQELKDLLHTLSPNSQGLTNLEEQQLSEGKALEIENLYKKHFFDKESAINKLNGTT
ncbi:MAG: hypothetical protein EOP00_17125 [Pedobacter sp.]|nr:MAG: hypothetical protein EOP00_17125 [Pedobacter sp.]